MKARTASVRLESLSGAADRMVPILLGVAALAAAARRIDLPWTPVPITGQTFAVLMLGALLGPERATLAVLTYLAVGLAGAPVFSYGGGAACLIGPTGGFLMGFVPGAYLAGALAERRRGSGSILLAFLAPDAAHFAGGVPWRALFRPPGGALAAGLLYFLPGEAVKIVLAALVLQRLRG